MITQLAAVSLSIRLLTLQDGSRDRTGLEQVAFAPASSDDMPVEER
jgi:hypothetical protein